MDRLAILIEASKLKDHDPLPGAVADVENYAEFLKSPVGGAWQESEITTLHNPRRENLKRYIQIAAHYDFTMVTFSGHGHHVVGAKGVNETRLCLNDTEEIAVHELNPGNPWSLVIADTCRKVTVLEMEYEVRGFRNLMAEKRAHFRPDAKKCRELFDKSITEAEKGPITMYSCDLNEAAGESSRGGYFSCGLLEISAAWADRGDGSVLRSNTAFTGAAAYTTNKNPQQHPVQEAGRRLVHLPFAVLAY